MSKEKIPMTPAGFKKLKAELKRLKEVDRSKVIQDLEEARSHGDLSENAEYDAAKEKQQQIMFRISELEDKLSRADVIDISKLSGHKISFGAHVILLNLENNEEKNYTIVGPEESDIDKGLLSVSSPLARALIGREEGDLIKVKTPSGEKEYEIIEVCFS